MQKKISLHRLGGNVFRFIGDNLPLLLVLGFFSFAGSYTFNLMALHHRKFFVLPYVIYIYFYYYFFMALYFEQKPLFDKAKFADSLKRFFKILLFSLCVLLSAHIAFSIVRYVARSFYMFPSFYRFLQQTYRFVLTNPYTKVGVFIGSLFLLTFSFFIPSFSWVSSINGQDNSIISAYTHVRGNFLKVCLIFICIFGLLPILISLGGMYLSWAWISFLYALLSIFQLVVYLKIYDFFYSGEGKGV